jgi:hypothetical protein
VAIAMQASHALLRIAKLMSMYLGHSFCKGSAKVPEAALEDARIAASSSSRERFGSSQVTISSSRMRTILSFPGAQLTYLLCAVHAPAPISTLRRGKPFEVKQVYDGSACG